MRSKTKGFSRQNPVVGDEDGVSGVFPVEMLLEERTDERLCRQSERIQTIAMRGCNPQPPVRGPKHGWGSEPWFDGIEPERGNRINFSIL